MRPGGFYRKYSGMIEYPVNADVSASPLPFSPATKVGNLIFVSGQASTDATGQIVSDTFEAEFRRSMENVRRILRACGSDLDKVARVDAWPETKMRLPTLVAGLKGSGEAETSAGTGYSMREVMPVYLRHNAAGRKGRAPPF